MTHTKNLLLLVLALILVALPAWAEKSSPPAPGPAKAFNVPPRQ